MILVHLPAGKTSPALHHALLGALAGLPTRARQSLTWDQGIDLSVRSATWLAAVHAEIDDHT